jgi:phosphoenolpyruvate carboxylase
MAVALEQAVEPLDAEGGNVLHVLRGLLDGVIEDRHGRAATELVHGMREAAEAYRREPGGDRLSSSIAGLDREQCTRLARVCSMQLAMINLSEELSSYRSDQRGARGSSDPDSLQSIAARMHDRPDTPTIDIRLVMTAHPTDVSRRSVLSKRQTVLACVGTLTSLGLDPEDRLRCEREASEALSIWDATNEVRAMRPRVADEVRRVLFFFESVLVGAAAELARGYTAALGQHPSAAEALPPVRFGSWAGGDMDGNPYVTPTTILSTLRAHRTLAIRLLIDALRPLRREFSQADCELAVTDELRESLARDEEQLPKTAEDLAARYPHERREPLRRKLAFAIARLQNTLAAPAEDPPPGGAYASADALRADLEAIADSVGCRAVSRGRLETLIWQTRIFGFHLATLEVRENAPELHKACRALLPGFAAAETEDERVRLLSEACLHGGTAEPAPGPLPKAAAAFDVIAAAVQRYGSQALDTFILSNAEQPSDVLCALWLARRSGLFRPGGDGLPASSPVGLVPLFERRVSLERATETLGSLYANPAYARHLAIRQRHQEVMIGYSDAGKDMGYVASQWTMYDAQKQIAAQARDHDVTLRLFHGRGGSSPRGGGPAQRAILAQPHDTVGGSLKITEQGEVISAKFSDVRSAARSLRETLGAVVDATLDPGEAIEPSWPPEMERIAASSRRVYQALVVEDRDFPTVFWQCTPIDVLGELNIGSRPASRGGSGAIQELRAIPWVFAWMQNRVGLPSWYGAGSGLASGDLEVQRRMYARWTLFRAVTTTLEAALAACDLEIGARYLSLAEDQENAQRIWRLITDEHDRCQARLLEITGGDGLRPSSAGADERHERVTWLDILSFLQLDLLRRSRAGDASANEALLATVTGIATGLKTTG